MSCIPTWLQGSSLKPKILKLQPRYCRQLPSQLLQAKLDVPPQKFVIHAEIGLPSTNAGLLLASLLRQRLKAAVRLKIIVSIVWGHALYVVLLSILGFHSSEIVGQSTMFLAWFSSGQTTVMLHDVDAPHVLLSLASISFGDEGFTRKWLVRYTQDMRGRLNLFVNLPNLGDRPVAPEHTRLLLTTLSIHVLSGLNHA